MKPALLEYDHLYLLLHTHWANYLDNNGRLSGMARTASMFFLRFSRRHRDLSDAVSENNLKQGTPVIERPAILGPYRV